MTFGSLDCSFRNILSVVIRRYQLIRHLIILDGLLELDGALVIEDMALRDNSTHLQLINQNLVCLDNLRQLTVFHGFHTYAGTVRVD